jgi:hypothetical protein
MLRFICAQVLDEDAGFDASLEDGRAKDSGDIPALGAGLVGEGADRKLFCLRRRGQ